MMVGYAFVRIWTWYRSSPLRCSYVEQLQLGKKNGDDAEHPKPSLPVGLYCTSYLNP
jgi:hypothetical protein